MKTRDAIRKLPATITASATVRIAAQLLDRDAVGALIVTDDSYPVGVVTDRDIVVRGVARGVDPDARIDSLMTPEPVTIDASADLREALRIFRSHPFRRLPVTENGALVGMLTVDDLIIDLAADLGDLARPVTGQVIFGSPEPATPATIA